MTEDLRRLLAEATPGPWTHRPNHKPYRIVVFGGRKAYEKGFTTSDIEAADAALIVAAVNALPALLDVVEAARRMRAVNDLASSIHVPERRAARLALGGALDRLERP